MRRRVNIKFLGFSLALFLFLGVGVHFLHGFQVKRTATTYLTLANQAEEGGRLDKNAEYLDLYIHLEPTDAVALARYGIVLDKLASSSSNRREQALRRFSTLLVLERALILDPGRDEVRRKAVHLAMNPALGRFADAQAHLDILLQSSRGDGELWQLLGECHEVFGKMKEAARSYKEAIRNASTQVESYGRLAVLLRRDLGDPKGADRTLDELVTANEKSAQAYLVRARHYREFSSRELIAGAKEAMLARAREAVAEARRLGPEDADVLLESADFARLSEKTEEARKYLQRALELHPQNAAVYRALARLEVQDQKPQATVDCLRLGAKALPDNVDLLWYLADLLVQKSDTADGAREKIARLRQLEYPAVLVDYLDARLSVAKKKWAEAIGTLERIRPQLAKGRSDLDEQADLLLGRCYEQLGNPDQAYVAYDRAVAASPLSLPACLGLGAAQAALSKLDEALDTYRKIDQKVPEVWILEARILVLKNLRLPSAQRQWREVEQVLDRAARTLPDSVDVPILRAEVLVAQRRADEARRVLEEARKKQPKQVELWTALVALADRQGQADVAGALLIKAEQELGDLVVLRLARLALVLKRRDAEARTFLERLGQDVGKFSAEDRQRLQAGLASGYHRLGEVKEARRIWAGLATDRPDDLGVKLVLFDLAVMADDGPEMEQLIQDIESVEGPDGALHRYGKACHLAWKAQQGEKSALAVARSILEEVAKLRPNWSRVPYDMGKIEDQAANIEAAIEHYRRALKLGERDPALVRRLVLLLHNRRRYTEAEQVVQQLPEGGPAAGDLQRVVSDIALQRADTDRALELAQKGAANSKDYRDHLWLGQVLGAVALREAGRLQEADWQKIEEALRRAIELADKAPEAWVALVRHLARTGQKEKAEAALREAERKLPKDVAPLALAQCNESLGLMDQAKKWYQAALVAKPEDVQVLRNFVTFFLRAGRPREAEPHLQKIIALKAPAPEDAAWARRVLALAMTVQGDYRQSQKALEVLGVLEGGQNGPVGGTIEDQRARAVVLATQKSRSQRLQAVSILEELCKREGASAEDRFLLAQLYESTGNWPKAQDQLLRLLTTEKGEIPRFLAALAHGLLRHGDTEGAGPWLAKLEQKEPDSLRTLDVKARVLQKQGKVEEAVRLLKKYVQGKEIQAGVVAAILDEMGHPAAEELYRTYVAHAKRPDSILVLADYLGRQNRVPEALDLCERALQTCSPQAVATINVTVLYAGKGNEEQCQRVARQLEAAILKEPQSTQFVTQLANVRSLQGRYQEAEALYRKVIERDDRDAMARNNLAWLAALRKGNGAEALKWAQQALEIMGPTPAVLDTRAVVYLSLGRADLAIKDLDEAIAEKPTGVFYFHLALAQQMNKNPEAAAAAWRKAKTSGLKESDLHVLERANFEKVALELAHN